MSERAASASGESIQDLPQRAAATAAQWIQDGRRIDMQGLASELGVSRVTLFRHAGGRETVIGAALWLLADRSMKAAQRRHDRDPSPGPRTAGVLERFNELIAAAPGLRRLLDDEPGLALRVLTDPRGAVQPGAVAALEQMLRQDEQDLGRALVVDAGSLAFALVRLGESFLYADVLASRTPDVQAANRLQRALIEDTAFRPAEG